MAQALMAGYLNPELENRLDRLDLGYQLSPIRFFDFVPFPNWAGSTKTAKGKDIEQFGLESSPPCLSSVKSLSPGSERRGRDSNPRESLRPLLA